MYTHTTFHSVKVVSSKLIITFCVAYKLNEAFVFPYVLKFYCCCDLHGYTLMVKSVVQV